MEGRDHMADSELKKEYLNSYKNLCIKLKSLEEQLQSLREVKQSAKVQKLSDMPTARRQSDLSDIMVQIEIIFTKIVNKRSECLRKKIEIENIIADIEDGIESSILRKRYIEFKTWDEICEDIDYSWRQTHYLHDKALAHLIIKNIALNCTL